MSQQISQTLGGSFKSKFIIRVIAEGDPVSPELLDLIRCRARSVLQRFVGATSSTPFCNCHCGLESIHCNQENFQII